MKIIEKQVNFAIPNLITVYKEKIVKNGYQVKPLNDNFLVKNINKEKLKLFSFSRFKN